MNGSRPSLRAPGQPRYAMLAQSLIEDISAGRYNVGDLIPTEHELCVQFNVSRSTVREAVRRLSDLGLVTPQAGVGTRVRAVAPDTRYVQTSEGISDLFQYVRDVRLEIYKSQEVVADETLAQLLECKPGQVWQHNAGARYLEGGASPVAVTDVYVARAYRGALGNLAKPDLPIYAMIEKEYGVSVAEIRQQVSAVLIEGPVADRLKIASGSPGLRVVRKYLSAKGEIFEVAVNLHPGAQFSYSSTLRMGSPGAG